MTTNGGVGFITTIPVSGWDTVGNECVSCGSPK